MTLYSISLRELFGIDPLPTDEYETDGSFYRIGTPCARDLAVLLSIAQHAKPKLIFELGTGSGWTIAKMLEYASPDTVACTLDLQYDMIGTELCSISDNDTTCCMPSWKSYYYEQDYSTRVLQYHCDTHAFTVPDALHGRVDIVFVDGSHMYDNVKKDTAHALRLRTDGGIILWHDYAAYECEGVTKFIHELSASIDCYYISDSASLVVA
jgi:SAM-dependent methyltransferase